MIGKIFITRQGYDPQLGKHIKDPYLGPQPSLGACRPDIRKQLRKGDHIFVISGKVPQANQFVMAGFEIEAKIDATEAYQLFPEQRLRQGQDGQLMGNIIVDANGYQHQLDNHNSFENRNTKEYTFTHSRKRISIQRWTTRIAKSSSMGSCWTQRWFENSWRKARCRTSTNESFHSTARSAERHSSASVN